MQLTQREREQWGNRFQVHLIHVSCQNLLRSANFSCFCSFFASFLFASVHHHHQWKGYSEYNLVVFLVVYCSYLEWSCRSNENRERRRSYSSFLDGRRTTFLGKVVEVVKCIFTNVSLLQKDFSKVCYATILGATLQYMHFYLYRKNSVFFLEKKCKVVQLIWTASSKHNLEEMRCETSSSADKI